MAEGALVSIITSRDPIAEAAGRVARAIAKSLERDGRARFAIPGGSALAAVAPTREALGPSAWSRVGLTWTDERCVPFDDADSSRGEAYRGGALAPRAPVARELALFLDGEGPDAAVARVERGLVEHFDGGLDVVLLGMGPDGHVASLFPGRPELAATGLAAHVPDSPKPPLHRITLTRRVLATARTVVLLATGEPKRAALERLAAGDPSLPASGLAGLTVVTDLTRG